MASKTRNQKGRHSRGLYRYSHGRFRAIFSLPLHRSLLFPMELRRRHELISIKFSQFHQLDQSLYRVLHPPENIENCIQSATPKVIFTINQCIDTIVTATKKLSTDAKIISFEEHPDLENLKTILEKQKTHEVDSFEISEVEDPNETVGLCYSSGTTSSPKPIEISHSMYFYNIASLGSIMPKYSISLWYSKLSWITGEFFILGSIMRCATRVVHSNPDEEETLGVIDKFQVLITLMKIYIFFDVPITTNEMIPLGKLGMCLFNIFGNNLLPQDTG